MPSTNSTPKSAAGKGSKKDQSSTKKPVTMHQILQTQEQEVMSVASLASLSTNNSRKKTEVASKEAKSLSTSKSRSKSPNPAGVRSHTTSRTSFSTPQTDRKAKTNAMDSHKRPNSAPPKQRA